MNIFFLHTDPVLSAQYHCDKHVVKMILETAQILCTSVDAPTPYRSTHMNHPCVQWVKEDATHFQWTYLLGRSLCAEYAYRYDRKHVCEEKIFDWMHKEGHFCFSGERGSLYKSFRRAPAQAMPEAHRHALKGSVIEDCEGVVNSYRKYYIHDKRALLSYTLREEPPWIFSECREGCG